MKKLISIFLLLVGAVQSVSAMHIKGGELSYVYLGDGGNGTSRYRITLKLYIDCSATSPGQLDPQVPLTFLYASG